MESIDTTMEGIKVWATRDIHIPGKTMLVHNIHTENTENYVGQVYDLKINPLLQEEFPNIVTVLTIHRKDTVNNVKRFKIKVPVIPFVLLNLGYEDGYIGKDMVLGYLENSTIEVNDIMTTDGHEAINKRGTEVELSEKKFITSPADIDTQRRVQVKDADVGSQYREQFEQLCEEYDDIFST